MSYKLGRELYRIYGTHLMQCKYSTCSQLGLMVSACGCLCFSSVLYQLVNHDSFKALLFLSAGSLIHGFNRSQVRVKPLVSEEYKN